MDLEPGYRLSVAPHFSLSVDWPQRLLLGAVTNDDGRFLPGTAWRAPSVAEQQILVEEAGASTEDRLCLFALPQHLQAAFWAMLEQTPAAPLAQLEGFDPFVGAVARFLDFKGLPAPPGAVFDLVVSKAGQSSIQWDAESGRAIGLTFDLAGWLAWPGADQAPTPRLWGGINAGDEAVSVLFVNRTAAHLAADLARDRPEEPAPATLDALACRFLTRFPAYPLVRLRLEPGEGYRVPAGGILIDACTLDTEGPGLMLMVRDPANADAAIS